MTNGNASTPTFGRYLNLLMHAMNGAGVIWVFGITFLICADIVGRNVFDSPIRGVPEMVSLSLVACVFLQLAFAAHQDRLTRADILLSRLESGMPAVANGWKRILFLIAFAIFVFMAVGAWPDFSRALITDEFAGVEGLFTITVWPIKFLIVFGSAVVALEYLRGLVLSLRSGDATTRPRGGSAWLSLVVPIALAALFALLWTTTAEPRTVGAFMIVATLLLIALGMPIAIALLVIGFSGLAILKQDIWIATRTLSLAAEGTISEYVFATVPLFVLMGLFVNVSEIGRDAFKVAQRIFGWIYGGLGIATVAANAVFAAITGISIASAAIFTKIAVPEMVRQGYTARFAVGLTAGSSVLGMLIPPSLLLIIYGVIAEVSIGDLFKAAIIPGVILAAAFAVGVVLMAWLAPRFVGDVRRVGGADRETGDAESTGNPWIGMLLVVFLILLVLGGIYGGVVTPTEAGAAGAFAAMLIALFRRRLTVDRLWEVIRETGQVSVTILFLIICASTFSRMLTLTELPQDIATFLAGTGLGMAGFLAAYLLLLIVLGTVLDSTSILLILLPLALPVVRTLALSGDFVAMGEDYIWFGIVTVVGIEIGLLTPPLGLSVYVIKSSLDDESISLGTIFAGSFPFVLITLAVTILLMAFPPLSLAILDYL
jgi:C4-dicarboxylate transporter DctM subunit